MPAPAPAAVVAAGVQTTDGGTIQGSVKAGNVPLPGVAITATNTLTGKKFATTTDIDGKYAMTIPKTGRYVVRAELAAFAPVTHEVRLTAEAMAGTAEFALELASRVEAQAASSADGAQALQRLATSLQRGTQTLSAGGGETGLEDATLAGGNAGGGNAGVSLPSLAGLGGGGDSAAGLGDSVTVSGQQGQMNPLAGVSEDQIRSRVEDAVQQARQNGGGQADQINAVVGMLGGMMGGGPGGFGGGGGGGRGGRGGPGGGGGAFRNFNPAQPHGAIFWTGGNSALNAPSWQPEPLARTNPSAYRNAYGVSILGSPYLPGLTRPDTRQFMFLNVTGQKNLNAFTGQGRVPTALERAGDFSQTNQYVNGALLPVQLYDPTTGKPIAGNKLAPGSLSPAAVNLLNTYYPLCNLACTTDDLDPRIYNYQTIANSGNNTISINTRYQRQLGAQTGSGARGGGFGGFGGGGQRGQNQKPVLRQNLNVTYNYTHNAGDNRNVFLPLGGSNASTGNGLNVGYTVGYGRLNNNFSVGWNRTASATRNYFTDTSSNPSGTLGIAVPNAATSISDPRFYNGLPSIGLTSFLGVNNTTPVQSVNQTISVSDSVGWRVHKHNFRFGADYRRVHADTLGGNNPLGSFTFSGFATSNPADQAVGAGGVNSGAGLADFLLGLPQTTSLQAPLNKIYLRENVLDWYVLDDLRPIPNVTLNYGLRFEYFGPYTEKNNRMVNLDHTADFSQVARVLAGATGAYSGGFPTSLVNPDYLMYSPRVAIAWSPKFKWSKQTVIRSGYGINYNTGQYSVFARSLSHQVPFANTQTNSLPIATRANPSPTATGCTTVSPGNPVASLTLENGFGCSTANAITNNYAVDKNYKLGMVQVFNVNVQKTLPRGIVFNLGYNGTLGSNLDVVGSPNANPSGVTTPGVSAFDYEESAASSRSNQMVVSLQQRQRKGVAVGATYTYSHSIDNASGVGGASGRPVQDFYRLDLEEGNSSFDQRHNLTGNWLVELPFGPNREFLNKGGLGAKILDGFSISGSFTFASGTYLTPTYNGNQVEAASGNTFTLRPDRVVGQAINGPGKQRQWFNTTAFRAPTVGQYGTASQGSIEGPGTVSTNAALSRTIAFGGTRSFEARVSANNVFNTVQYSGVSVNENAANFGQVTSAAGMRSLQMQGRFRF
jgi:hypothetical protein